MSARTFLDTNVLVYSDDHDSPQKQSIALRLIEDGHASGAVVISTQVLSEHVHAATRKLRVPIPIARAKVDLFAQLEVVSVGMDSDRRQPRARSRGGVR